MSQSRAGSYPESVSRLVEKLQSLPGVGRRSAERIAFWVLKARTDEALALSEAIAEVKRSVRHCKVCWNLTDHDPCAICADSTRDGSLILVVEQPRDLVRLDQAGMFRGVFHVLMGRLDPLDGVGPESLTINDLIARVTTPTRNARGTEVQEVILGLNPDLEGDSTAMWIAQALSGSGVRVTRLARGIPTGSQIEFANSAVLADAFAGRRSVTEH
ncbi:MAG: recombination mediator RecR [Planctomycetota bacterium]|nr:recombination mediator RecR [Planctomycetota bacterium]